MTKILNKKEQVIDFKLTPYGRYKLSIGTFKPVYYAFYDAGILYDGACGGLINEKQNDINPRIKDDTQYLATQVVFADVQDDPGISRLFYEDVDAVRELEAYTGFFGETKYKYVTTAEAYRASAYFPADITPELNIPATDFFKFDAAIGDAHFDGPTQQSAPAWKVVTLEGHISGTAARDIVNDQDIPQIDVTLNYIKTIDKRRFTPDPDSVYEIVGATPIFADNKLVRLVESNLLVYSEEINTDLLTENFEIEVFLSASDNTLQRKFFEKKVDQVVDGYMVSPTEQSNPVATLTTSSVEYYFDIFTDQEVSRGVACRGAETFNKNSYYIDIDFDCGEDQLQKTFYDIYGSATTEQEIDICQN